MTLRTTASLTFCAVALAGCALEPRAAEPTQGGSGVVARVLDGDTLALQDGSHVRLLQIDTPEVSARECGHDLAAAALRKLTPPGSTVQLHTDPALDERDRYGRLLRYVTNDRDQLVNVHLVAGGAAAPYFYRGERGMHATRLLEAARAARDKRRGTWGACPQARLQPDEAWSTNGVS